MSGIHVSVGNKIDYVAVSCTEISHRIPIYMKPIKQNIFKKIQQNLHQSLQPIKLCSNQVMHIPLTTTKGIIWIHSKAIARIQPCHCHLG